MKYILFIIAFLDPLGKQKKTGASLLRYFSINNLIIVKTDPPVFAKKNRKFREDRKNKLWDYIILIINKVDTAGVPG